MNKSKKRKGVLTNIHQAIETKILVHKMNKSSESYLDR